MSMTGDKKEEMLLALESASSFLRGMSFDHRIHLDVRDAMTAKADEIDSVVEAMSDE